MTIRICDELKKVLENNGIAWQDLEDEYCDFIWLVFLRGY